MHIKDEELPHLGTKRLAIGVLQGFSLWFLYQSIQHNFFPATNQHWFGSLLLNALIIPFLFISALGHVRAKQILWWLITAITVITLLTEYDLWRYNDSLQHWFKKDDLSISNTQIPSSTLAFYLVLVFFIAHALFLSGASEHRRIASYPSYFETAWKIFIQLSFSGLFVLVFWGVLWMGAAMFSLIHIEVLEDLLKQAWFAIPVTTIAFSCAIHITDVKPTIIRGIRSLLLVLFSWLLPIATILIAAFLVSLPFSGLTPLWETRAATVVLLASSSVLIILINAAFQNGEISATVPRLVRYSGRLAAWMLLPLVAIAAYALMLRIAQYGWSKDRVIAAALVFITAIYALGYFAAACQRHTWLSRVATVNIANAFVIVATLIALFTPIADPAKIAVNDQIHRLKTGQVPAAQFDFAYLKREGVRYGAAALQDLTLNASGKDAAFIKEKAALALSSTEPGINSANNVTAEKLKANIQVWPATKKLPESFVQQDWSTLVQDWLLPQCMSDALKNCDAYLIDLEGNGNAAILLVGSKEDEGAVIFQFTQKNKWEITGDSLGQLAGCPSAQKKLRAGDFQLVSPQRKNIQIAGQVIEVKTATQEKTFICPGN